MAPKNLCIAKLLIIPTLFVLVEARTAIRYHRYPRTTQAEGILSHTSKTPTVKIFLVPTKNTDQLLPNGDTTTKVNEIFNVTRTRGLPTVKKWQVGRVSRKQYEIINMLWRKTNIFVDDIDNTSHNYHNNETKKTIRRPKSTLTPHIFMELPFKILPTSTPSYIEFYYLDETVEDTKHKDPLTPKFERSVLDNLKQKDKGNNLVKSFSRSPFFAFHINDPDLMLKRVTQTHTTFRTTKPLPTITRDTREKTYLYDIPLLHVLSGMKLVTNMKDKLPIKFTTSHSLVDIRSSLLEKSVTETFLNSSVFNDKTFNDTIQPFMNVAPLPQSVNKDINNLERQNYATKTTDYDKIKFFELYDSNTHGPFNDKQKELLDRDDNENASEENDINIDNKIILQHADNDMDQLQALHKTRYAKKHVKIFERDTMKNNLQIEGNYTTKEQKVTNVNSEQKLNSTETVRSSETWTQFPKYVRDKVLNTDLTANISRFASWSEFPFAAVYVYERYQVHCDAAVISPHWLLASGSCLSRHSDDHAAEGRSAFVAYCGEKWWNPERIAYVKYSVVHPRYHPRDKIRRQLYNIGAIQVASSMASACNNWCPVSIMSHQFAADPEGSIASAVGWSLDRYTSMMLPRTPLTVYEGLVFSDSCPGNSGYRKAKFLNEDGVKNIYCLSLPPYNGEESDPVHGGLLLVGGKLIALYLQEERRQWGDQSAQYTGVWRLVPWLHDVAREPEEADFLL